MNADKTYYVYILASKKNGVLYIGVTNNLYRRMNEHRSENGKGFTHRYHVTKLVYYEQFSEPYHAICREKAMKKWYRKWKIELIEKNNPEWKDLVSCNGEILSCPVIR